MDNNIKLRYAPMWKFGTVFYHLNDRERIPGLPELKYVVMDKDYFIGTWQHEEHFAIASYDSKSEAESFITNY